MSRQPPSGGFVSSAPGFNLGLPEPTATAAAARTTTASTAATPRAGNRRSSRPTSGCRRCWSPRNRNRPPSCSNRRRPAIRRSHHRCCPSRCPRRRAGRRHGRRRPVPRSPAAYPIRTRSAGVVAAGQAFAAREPGHTGRRRGRRPVPRYRCRIRAAAPSLGSQKAISNSSPSKMKQNGLIPPAAGCGVSPPDGTSAPPARNCAPLARISLGKRNVHAQLLALHRFVKLQLQRRAVIRLADLWSVDTDIDLAFGTASGSGSHRRHGLAARCRSRRNSSPASPWNHRRSSCASCCTRW